MTDLDIVSPAGAVTGGVLFLHWFDPQADDGNKTQFKAQAEELATQGVVSALPQLVFPWSVDPVGSNEDVRQIELEVARLGKAVDQLATRGVERTVMVGHDFGAMHGALLMARDPRIVAGVLIAPANRWADWLLRFWPINEDRFEYGRAMRPLDAIEHVASIAPRPLLLQFATDDYFIAGMDASELYNTAGEPKQIKRYDADHGMRADQARDDRREFILEQLERG